LVEGSKLMAEALAWGRQPAMTFATSAWWADHPEVPGERFEVTEAVLAALATTETPDPVVGVFPLPAEPALPKGLVVVAHKLQDPGNLGTIIRSADAAGASAVVITPETVDPYGPKTVRATMGSLFHLPVLKRDLDRFKAEWQGPIYAMTLDGASSLYGFDYRGDAAFLIGNEGAGLSPEDAARADHRVMIPMAGHAESLNAAMAATICLFEAARQRLV
jgi:TrmH family RNA methyltransferase